VPDAERLIVQAQEATELEDFGGDSWREGLDRLVAAQWEEAGLNQLGVQIAAGEAVMYLSNRLCVTDCIAAAPR